jgi:ABC-type glycerol-3-phosphate transport system permease component
LTEKQIFFSPGIYYAVGGIGIGLGFLATSQFLKVYTYIKKPVWLTPNYSEWVGAWWLVYALGTCLSLILCLLLCLFDIGQRHRYFASKRPRQSLINPTYQVIITTSLNDEGSLTPTNSTISINGFSNTIEQPLPRILENESLKSHKDVCLDILVLIKQLFFNLRYMGVTGCAVIEALLIKGYLAFLSKHIEYQFRTTSSHSSIFMGVISLFSVIFGAPLGAYFVKRFDMNGRQCAKFCCIILATSSVIFLGLMLHCREPTIGMRSLEF